MATLSHAKVLQGGVAAWNAWRKVYPHVIPDLSGFDFTQLPVQYWQDSSGNRHAVQLWKIDLQGADLRGAILTGQELFEANLSNSVLKDALLNDSIIKSTTLRGADLRNANLKGARLINADLQEADLSGASIFGISPWGVELTGAIQRDLVITPSSAQVITVDSIEVAQFLYTLLENRRLRNVLDTISARAVLILGRFTAERKAVLEAIRSKLREEGFVPLMFDFERPTARDFTETIKTLAGMSRFIIADITNPRSSPLELQAVMPDYMIPFVPLIQQDEEPFAMFRDLQQKYGTWVLDVLKYDSPERLIAVFDRAVIQPALQKSDELAAAKAHPLKIRHTNDY